MVVSKSSEGPGCSTGDLDSTRFDDLMDMANQRKHEAKYAYVHHLDSHRCSMIAVPELQ